MKNTWLLIGVNAYTGERVIFDDAPTLELARAAKAEWQDKQPLPYCGITIEYGDKRDYVIKAEGRALWL